MSEKMDKQDFLKQELHKIELEPTDEQIQQLLLYYEIVVEKNHVMNLTAITEFEEFVRKHFVDSYMITLKNVFHAGERLIDIGTGAGFPGIPLKIMFPDLEIVLLDSLNKRILFLQDVIKKLQLTHITAIHARAEELARKNEYRETFDWCVSRAVASMSTLVEYCVPFVKVGGSFISYKSGKGMEELEQANYAIQTLGGCVGLVEKYVLPDTDMERLLIHVDKIKQTQKKYPRVGGKPSKEPLSL